jgi:hypothetical protein
MDHRLILRNIFMERITRLGKAVFIVRARGTRTQDTLSTEVSKNLILLLYVEHVEATYLN